MIVASRLSISKITSARTSVHGVVVWVLVTDVVGVVVSQELSVPMTVAAKVGHTTPWSETDPKSLPTPLLVAATRPSVKWLICAPLLTVHSLTASCW